MGKTYISIVVTEYPNCNQLKETYEMLGKLTIPLTIARCSLALLHELSGRVPVRHLEYLIECPDPFVLPAAQETKGAVLADAWYDLGSLEQAAKALNASGFTVCIASDDPVIKKLRSDAIEPHLRVPNTSIFYFHNLALLFHSYEWLCLIIKMRRTQRGEDAASYLIEGQRRWRDECQISGDSYIVLTLPALHLSSPDDFENFFKPFLLTLQEHCVVTTVSHLLNHFPKQDAAQFFAELRSRKPYRIALSITDARSRATGYS